MTIITIITKITTMPLVAVMAVIVAMMVWYLSIFYGGWRDIYNFNHNLDEPYSKDKDYKSLKALMTLAVPSFNITFAL